MFLKYEIDYAHAVQRILQNGVVKDGRNGLTKSIFGMSLEIDLTTGVMPLIQGRKMFHRGILGEFAALIRRPTNIADFERWGCNYWGKWANHETGALVLDYGNSWFDFNGVNQIKELKRALRNNPNDRRMIVNAWRPDRLSKLSLPCCHYSYQFNVENGKLNMIWTQRSADMMIGVPADMVLAAIWVITLANEVGLEPGRIKMDLGDCHVYEEHTANAYKYLYNVLEKEHNLETWTYPKYKLLSPAGLDFCNFVPADIHIDSYSHVEKLDFELKG